MGAFPLLTSLTLLPPAVPAGVLTLPLLAALALLAPAPAQAQSVNVSNLTESGAGYSSVSNNEPLANAFDTGGTSTDRYTLNSVIINVENSGSGALDVSIHNANGSNPGTKIGSNLTGTIGSTGGNTTYTAGSGNTITLNGGATYFVQISASGSTSRRIDSTTSDAQTGTTGWSIANTGRWSTDNGASWNSFALGDSIRFTVNATAVAKTLTVSNRTQTGATLTIANHSAAWWYKQTGPTAGTGTPRTTAQTTATLTGLTANTSYTYKAYSQTGCNAADVIATAMFSTNLPQQTSLTGATAGNGQVTLAWNKVTGAAGYWYRVVDGNRIVKSDWFPASYGDDTSGVVTGLTNGREYTFQVRAMFRGPATRYIQWVGGPWTRTLNETPEGPPPDHCIQTLAGDGSVTGRWVLNHDNINKDYVPECPSFSPSDRSDRSDYAARYYRFTVPAGADREVTLEVSASTGFRLYRWAGHSPQSNRSAVDSSNNTRMVRRLGAGNYTVEVTTAVRLFPRGAEEFTLTLSGTGRSVPDPGGGGGAGTGTEQQEQQEQQGQQGQQGQVQQEQQEQEPQVTITNTRTRPSVGNRLRPPRPGTTSLAFPVTLSPAASEPVQVDYTTRNGTARAGEDYVSASGTLTFVPGQTAQTVAVAVLPGERPGDGETMTLELSNPQGGGAVIADGQGVGTILTVAAENPTGAVKQQTTRLGRTVAEQVLDAVDARMGSAPTPGLAMTLAGQPLQWPTVADTNQPVAEQVTRQVVDHLTQWVSISDGNVAVRTLGENELLASSSFALNTAGSGGGLLSFWGGGAVTSFDGRDGELSLDGKVTTWLLGADWHWGQWPDGGNARRSTAGLLVSRSSSSGGYDSGSGGVAGDVDSTLTGAFPWLRHRFTERLEVWGAAGYGQGDLKVTPNHPGTDRKGAAMETDLNLWLAAGGLRGTLLEGGNDGLTLTGKSDVMAVGTSSGSADGLEAADARLTRLRLALEAERPIPFGKAESEADADARGTLTPSLEVAMRYDGGDGDTGFGLDLGGGIVLSHPSHGLQAEVRGRGLLSHAAEGFRNRGFSGSLSWRQRPDSDLGAMVSLKQTMGGPSSGGADALLNRVTLEGLAANNNGNGSDDLKHQRLELQLGYGFSVFGDRFTLTPELGLGFYNTGRDYRIGWNLKRPGDGDALDLSFDLTRRENTGNDGGAPEHGVRFGVNTRF